VLRSKVNIVSELLMDPNSTSNTLFRLENLQHGCLEVENPPSEPSASYI
jgi:hypothetical protein